MDAEFLLFLWLGVLSINRGGNVILVLDIVDDVSHIRTVAKVGS
jgi:hypothetical protein